MCSYQQGKVAYASQQPWIRNLTVRENITFGKRMDAGKYQSAIEACQLEPDFEMLPAGDETEVGEQVSKRGKENCTPSKSVTT